MYLIPPFNSLPHDFEGLNTTFEDLDALASPLEQLLLGHHAPIAPLYAHHMKSIESLEVWACAQLVHIHAARDHLVLTDPSVVELTEDEEHDLRLSVIQVLADLAPEGVLVSHSCWLFKAHEFSSLKTSSPELASGLNIDAWNPRDINIAGIARKWRALQNEIQMIWHDHPVNIKRVERGELPINSIWLYGVGHLSAISTPNFLLNTHTLVGNTLLLRALSAHLHKIFTPIDDLLDQKSHIGAGSFIDGHQLHKDAWEFLWVQALKALHQQKTEVIEILIPGFKTTQVLRVHADHLKPGFFDKLFFKKRIHDIMYPTWSQFIQQPHAWKALSV